MFFYKMKAFSTLVIYMVVWMGSVESSPSTFICPGVGLYIDPTNCTNFYSCDQDQNPIPGSCTGGKGSFDNVTKTCSASSCFNCVSPGFFADPDDCHSFYVCSEKLIATHSTCTSVGHFDPILICAFGACVPGTTTEAPPFTCTSVGYFADRKDCRSYYYCDESLTPYRGICMGGGGYFDKQEKGCTVGKCSN